MPVRVSRFWVTRKIQVRKSSLCLHQTYFKQTSNTGIIPSALNRIFDRLEKTNENTENSSVQWRVEVSYIEIYNQQVRDLLKKPKKFMGVTMSRQNLKIRNNKGYVASLRSPPPQQQQQHANTDTCTWTSPCRCPSKVQRKVWRRCTRVQNRERPRVRN